jgi:hypothetical protein
VIERRDANRLTHQHHQSRGFDALAGNVADADHDFARYGLECIVPVAADGGFG